MALSKHTFFTHHLKTLAKPHYLRRPQPPPPSFISLRLLSFATPEEAAAERRKRKRRLRIEPPLSTLRQQHQPRPTTPQNPSSANNPNAPKIPETVSVLSGNRLNLHNKILKLIRENDLEEAALYTRHSVYSNCRPTIFTCNAVMAAQLRQSRYSDLLSLHRFITQAGVAANIVTHNLLLTAYMDCRKTDMAMEHYKQLINNAPFNPSPTTYRILIKGLVDNNKIDRALELKEEMLSKGFSADPIVYSYLMSGQAKGSKPDGVFELYEELKEKLGGYVSVLSLSNLSALSKIPSLLKENSKGLSTPNLSYQDKKLNYQEYQKVIQKDPFEAYLVIFSLDRTLTYFFFGRVQMIGRGKGRSGTGRRRGHFQGRDNAGAMSQPQVQPIRNTATYVSQPQVQPIGNTAASPETGE